MSSRKSFAIAGAAATAGWLANTGYRRYRRELSEAQRRVNTGSLLANTACGPIEYALQGQGAPLLVVHGAGGGFDQGLLFARGLAERDFSVIAMSRFGYLRTPLPKDASPQAQADAHANLLDSLQIERASIIGVSAGAPSALQFAIRHPDRCSGLILLVPLTWAPGNAPASIHRPARAAELSLRWLIASDLAYWMGLRYARDLVIRTVLGTPPKLVRDADPDEQERIDEVLRSVLPLSSRELGLGNDARVATSLERYDLEAIRAPTLVIALRDDLYGMFSGAQYTARHVHGAEFVCYESGGHLWVGHQQAMLETIATFAARVRAGGARDGR